MRLGRVTAVTICLILQLTASCVSSRPVSMYVRQEAYSLNYLHVNFYSTAFQRLHECMSQMNFQQCFVKAEYESSGKPFPGLNYKVVNVRSYGISHLVQSSFTCLYNQKATTLECTRNTGQCRGNNCTSFRLGNSPICECVYLSWQYPNETLVFDSNTNIEYCTEDCAETTTAHSTESSVYPSLTSLASEQSSDATTSATNATNIPSFGRDEPSTNTVPVVIGVVLAVLFVAVIVIVVGFVYRRKKQLKKQASNNGIISSRTNTTYNNRGPAQSQASNIPDVLNTLPYSSHGGETNRESEDGYYTIDKDYGLNRYENGLNTISSKTSQRPTEGAFSSRGLNTYTNELRAPPRVSPQTLHIYEGDAGNSEVPHALEGDYFTIETKNDDGKKHTAVESIFNSRHLNKYTNELRFFPQTSHTYESDAGNSEVSHALEGDYFTIDTENDGEKNKPIESALNSRHLNKHTNELRVSPKTSHTFEDDAVKSESLHTPEGDYFTLETENDFGEDDTTVNEEQTIDGGYSLAKDVGINDDAAVVDVIDVSPPPKNIYSKFADNNNTEMKNPYDMLLEKHQILNSRKTSVDETP